MFGSCCKESRKMQYISMVGDDNAEFSVLSRCSNDEAIVDSKVEDYTGTGQ